MILRFGTVERPVYENGIAIDRTALIDGKGEPYAYQVKLGVNVRLVKTSSNSLDDQIAEIEQLYQQQDVTALSILYDDGSPTIHSWPSQDRGIIGDVRVSKPLSYLKFTNGEHVSYRSATIEFELIESWFRERDKIIEFSETIEGEGGGTLFGYLQPNEGPPVRQRLRTNNLWRGTQSGRVVRFGSYGNIPSPLFPNALVGAPQIRRESPRRIGNDYILFPTSYTYRFESPVALSSAPTTWF